MQTKSVAHSNLSGPNRKLRQLIHYGHWYFLMLTKCAHRRAFHSNILSYFEQLLKSILRREFYQDMKQVNQKKRHTMAMRTRSSTKNASFRRSIVPLLIKFCAIHQIEMWDAMSGREKESKKQKYLKQNESHMPHRVQWMLHISLHVKAPHTHIHTLGVLGHCLDMVLFFLSRIHSIEWKIHFHRFNGNLNAKTLWINVRQPQKPISSTTTKNVFQTEFRSP